MTLRLVTDAEAPARTYVPDGEPCQKHGLPARLHHAPGLGYYSQCQGCIDAFLDWFPGDVSSVRRVDNTELRNPLTPANPVEKQHQLELGVTDAR